MFPARSGAGGAHGVGVLLLVALGLAVAPPAPPALAAEAQPLGIARFSLQTTRADESQPFVSEPYEFTQASGHPFALTAQVEFTSRPSGSSRAPTGEPRDVLIELPPGLLANSQAVVACQPAEVPCPTDSQVGYFVLRAGSEALLAPIVNLAPEGTELAALGLESPLGLIRLHGRLVRTPAGYALAVVASDLNSLGIVSIEMTLWGVPADKAHDPLRGRNCIGNEADVEASCSDGGLKSGEEERAFLTMPSDCGTQAPIATAWVDSWERPGQYRGAESSFSAPDSCDALSFLPQLALQPDNAAAEAPVGVDVSVEVAPNEAPLGASAPPLRSATVTLPQGMSINSAAGLSATACAGSGGEGIDLPTGLAPDGNPLGPGEVGEGEQAGPEGEAVLAAGHCPEASTVGVAEAQSPLVAGAIVGRVYLAAPLCGSRGEGPCVESDAADGRLLRVYVELGGRGERRPRGLVLKLAGAVRIDPATGQLTLEISEAPQLPLSKLELRLSGGARALLVNPSSCGQATTSSELQPWGTPAAPGAAPSSYYEVAGCPRQQPFRPVLLAGSYGIDAGAFTPFVFAVKREAQEQQLAALQLQAPAGVAALLASVTPCQEPAAGRGDCPQSARIGSSAVALGSGSQPLRLGGDVYLTGPYRGAPFGLAIVTHALVGPLDLGEVTIRARLSVDPDDGALTVTSDPLPQILLGVPLRLRELSLEIDRPRFIVNPTSCRRQRVLASVAAPGGALATLSNPFAVANCSSLGFAPRVAASTSAAASIGDGASLDLRLAQSAGPGSGQANLARLRIALPPALPTRLTALQSACRATVFAANPARCPAASLIGVARAGTPLLSAPLQGPVYLVAHGRGQLPAPTVVLQGQGVRLDLSGTASVERSRGRTAIAFDALPDLPLRSIELLLPRGPHSVLGRFGNLCAAATAAHTLPLPLELAAQNGRVIHRSASIAVRGCRRVRRHKKS